MARVEARTTAKSGPRRTAVRNGSPDLGFLVGATFLPPYAEAPSCQKKACAWQLRGNTSSLSHKTPVFRNVVITHGRDI